jgi:hypothetical protein
MRIGVLRFPGSNCRELALSDVAAEYEAAMQRFPVR